MFVCIPLMALATAGFGSVSLICGLWDRAGRQQHFIARVWAAVMLRMRSVSGAHGGRGEAEEFARRGICLEPSELHGYSGAVCQAAVPVSHSGQAGLWKMPFVGWYLKRSGQVPIDSGSSRSAIAGLLRGVAALKAGMPLLVFPEGSRSPDGHMQAAHLGGAFMALRAGVPLVPLALIGTYELLPIHVYSLRPRPLMIMVGEPISTGGLTTKDADALTERLYEEIGKMYYRYSDLAPAADSRAAGKSHNSATRGA